MTRSLKYGCFVFLLIGLFTCQRKQQQVFDHLEPDRTGIHFNNFIDEDEQNNVSTYMNIYTGGGLAAGDINNDGLTDLFFSGNMVSSRLYLNKGDLRFEDITESSGILNTSWGTGATIADEAKQRVMENAKSANSLEEDSAAIEALSPTVVNGRTETLAALRNEGDGPSSRWNYARSACLDVRDAYASN